MLKEKLTKISQKPMILTSRVSEGAEIMRHTLGAHLTASHHAGEELNFELWIKVINHFGN